MDKKSINKQIRAISNRSSLLLLIFFAFAIPFRLFIGYMKSESMYGSIWDNDLFTTILVYVGLYAVLYPILFLLFYKRLNRQNGLRLKDSFGKSRRSTGWILKWTIIALGCSQLPGCLINLFVEGKTTTMNSVAAKNEPISWIIYGVSLMVLAPFFEEILHRSILFRNNEPIGQTLAAVITGIGFGLWHININQVFSAAIFGVFLCLVYAKTRSVSTTIFMHFTNNLISFLTLFVKTQLKSFLSAGDKVFMVQAMFRKQTVFAVLLTLLMIVLIGLFIAGPVMLTVQIVKKRKGLGLDKGIFSYSAWKKALVYLSAPLTIIVLAIMICFTFFL